MTLKEGKRKNVFNLDVERRTRHYLFFI